MLFPLMIEPSSTVYGETPLWGTHRRMEPHTTHEARSLRHPAQAERSVEDSVKGSVDPRAATRRELRRVANGRQ